MILIALGANLPHPVHGPPRATLAAALAALEGERIRVLRRSRWYGSPAWPSPAEPRYTNAAAAVGTDLPPADLLSRLLRCEERFGRTRSMPNAPRTIDLDIVAYDDLVVSTPELVLPHPRLRERAFVLLPLAEVAPGWRHPATGESVEELIAALPPGHGTEPD